MTPPVVLMVFIGHVARVDIARNEYHGVLVVDESFVLAGLRQTLTTLKTPKAVFQANSSPKE